MKKKLTIFLVLCVVILCPLSAVASGEGESYLYSYTNEGIVDVSAPQPYLVDTVYTNQVLGTDFSSPEDMTRDGDGNFYICDSVTNSIYLFDEQWKLKKTIRTFENNGREDGFNAPMGICVDADKNLFIADAGNSRIVTLDPEGRLIQLIEKPQSDILADDFAFIPQKVLVDSANRIFVLCKNVYEGILQFSESGAFIGFVGSNKVVASPLDVLWKKIMTQTQRSKMDSFIPVEYTNISLDYQDFIYAVTSVSNVDSPIRRLNPSGEDVLVRSPTNGSKEVVGDALYTAYSKYSEVSTGPSSFVDITSDQKGNYYALDGNRGRVFAYDEEGNMLFVFGSMKTGQKGSLESPSAIEYVDGKIYILDRALGSVLSYQPTEYVQCIHQAMEAYLQQDYQKSVELWKQLIRQNSNLDVAYVKAGYGLYRLKQYEEAMEYFKLVNAKSAYSKAYQQYMDIQLNRYFNLIVALVLIVVLLIVAAVTAFAMVRRKRTKKAKMR